MKIFRWVIYDSSLNKYLGRDGIWVYITSSPVHYPIKFFGNKKELEEHVKYTKSMPYTSIYEEPNRYVPLRVEIDINVSNKNIADHLIRGKAL